MSVYDDRHEALRRQFATVQEELAGLPKERRESIQDEVSRLEAALGFGSMIVDKTDPELVPDAAHSELAGALTQITEQVVQAGADPGSFTETFLNAVSRLPAARGEIAAQKLKGTVADVKRSATRRLNSLTKHIETASAEAEALRGEIDQRRAEWDEAVDARKREFDTAIDARLAEFRTELEELRSAVEAEKQRVEGAATEQAEQFRAHQEQRAEEFKEKEREYEERVAEVERAAKEQVASLVGEIEEMKERSAQLVGAIGITGTAERYGKEADEQKTVADRSASPPSWPVYSRSSRRFLRPTRPIRAVLLLTL
jgi:DNA repair exonuclease SbcCD ATPase subunit